MTVMRYGVPIVAWTGGDRPLSYGQISTAERRLVKLLFWEQMRDFRKAWADFLGPDDKRASMRVFWGRARYDAHASVRAAQP